MIDEETANSTAKVLQPMINANGRREALHSTDTVVASCLRLPMSGLYCQYRGWPATTSKVQIKKRRRLDQHCAPVALAPVPSVAAADAAGALLIFPALFVGLGRCTRWSLRWT